jgi:hypothetical protein
MEKSCSRADMIHLGFSMQKSRSMFKNPICDLRGIQNDIKLSVLKSCEVEHSS